jgi:thiamine pyrophosphokinase
MPPELDRPISAADTAPVMRAFLFIGGEYPEKAQFLSQRLQGDYIACADSGLDAALAWGLEPGLVVGDMDSLSSEKALGGLEGAKIVRLPTAKDDTDTEAALKILWREGYDDVCLVGGGGGRMDHFLALAALFERTPSPRLWLCSSQTAEPLEGTKEFDCPKGSTVSVFPLGAETLRMESSGLKWPLAALRFERGAFGISNEATQARVRLEVVSGRALIIRTYPRPGEGRPGPGRRLP